MRGPIRSSLTPELSNKYSVASQGYHHFGERAIDEAALLVQVAAQPQDDTWSRQNAQRRLRLRITYEASGQLGLPDTLQTQRRAANLLGAGVRGGQPREYALCFTGHLHTPRDAPLQGLVLPMPTLEILLQELPGRLLLADTALEKQMLRVAASIHRVQLHRLHLLAELLAQSATADRRQLLEVSAYHRERQVWLLLDTGEKALPVSICIL